MPFAWQSDRSKSGFKTEEWSGRRNTKWPPWMPCLCIKCTLHWPISTILTYRPWECTNSDWNTCILRPLKRSSIDTVFTNNNHNCYHHNKTLLYYYLHYIQTTTFLIVKVSLPTPPLSLSPSWWSPLFFSHNFSCPPMISPPIYPQIHYAGSDFIGVFCLEIKNLYFFPK